MNKYLNQGYTISQLLDCGVDKSVMSKQDYVDMVTQHRPMGVYNVDYTMSSYLGMSSKLLSSMSTKLFVQQVLTVAHVGDNMNLTRRQQMSNNLKKIQIIKTLALK